MVAAVTIRSSEAMLSGISISPPGGLIYTYLTRYLAVRLEGRHAPGEYICARMSCKRDQTFCQGAVPSGQNHWSRQGRNPGRERQSGKSKSAVRHETANAVSKTSRSNLIRRRRSSFGPYGTKFIMCACFLPISRPYGTVIGGWINIGCERKS